jgi:hypothetical protein
MMTTCFPSSKRVHPKNGIVAKEKELDDEKKNVS